MDFLIILLFVPLLKIFYLQIIQFDRFTALSKNNSIKIVPLPPKRGVILDRNNVILADNNLVHSLEIDRSFFLTFLNKVRLKNKLGIAIDFDIDIDITTKKISYLYENTVPISFSLTTNKLQTSLHINIYFPNLVLNKGL